MGFYRLDFWDKLVISITCVIVTFICLFNTFSFGLETIDFSTSIKVSNLTFGSGNTFYESSSGYSVFYIKVDPSIIYTLNSSEGVVFSTAYELPSDGVERFNFSTSILEDYEVSGFNYITIRLPSSITSVPTGLVTISYDSPSGISLAVSSLVQNVGIPDLWDTFSLSIPYVLVVVVVGFGFYMILTMIRKILKGKSRL